MIQTRLTRPFFRFKIDNSHSNDPVLDEFEPTPLQTDFPVSISISASVSI
jgi:hypothetical protein